MPFSVLIAHAIAHVQRKRKTHQEVLAQARANASAA